MSLIRAKCLLQLMAAACLVACASQDVTERKVRVMRYSEATYAPTSVVEVLRTKPSERPYEELAELSIRLRRADEEMAVVHLKEKAKSLGADALIIIGESSRGAIAIPVGTAAVAVPIRSLSAVAIRYKR
jgi:hypothetical protein